MVIIDARHVPGIERVFAIASKETTARADAPLRPRPLVQEGGCGRPHLPGRRGHLAGRDRLLRMAGRPRGVPAAQACYPHGGDRLAPPLPLPDLSKGGYRLPTRDEWEYASLAGATTRRHYGDGEKLLDRYALFFHPEGGEPAPTRGTVVAQRFRPVRRLWERLGVERRLFQDGKQVIISGGSYHNMPVGCTSRERDLTLPGLNYDSYGFRIARTIELNEKGEPGDRHRTSRGLTAMEVVLPTCIGPPGRLFSDLDRARSLARSLERYLRPDEPWTIHVIAADDELDAIRAGLRPFRLDLPIPPPRRGPARILHRPGMDPPAVLEARGFVLHPGGFLSHARFRPHPQPTARGLRHHPGWAGDGHPRASRATRGVVARGFGDPRDEPGLRPGHRHVVRLPVNSTRPGAPRAADGATRE